MDPTVTQRCVKRGKLIENESLQIFKMSKLVSTLDDQLSPQYFFIVSQDNGLVLDISTGNKGGNLLLSEADGRPSQLWRWDEDCRLVSKLGLVADIKHKSKKTGAVCHAWDAHDGLNQKWRVEDETIKSDFNNLVIDAVTQLVSMHAVNGSATQKWYFVPENEWPDGRQIVPSVKYFFILSQDNGLVLDISTGEKGGNLLLTEADEKPSQLWRWDEDCRLVSKLGLVADIKHKSKKAEAVCHAWDAHDGLNQKWRVEDEAIKSNLSNLVIDAVTQPVSMHEANGSQTQKWYFVPENKWPDGRLIVPSVKYFFVVSQDNGLVLDISTVQKGAHLVLSEVNKESSQLWRWDEDGRLVSKLGLVADIKGKSKKAGAVCHAWDAHDDLNRKWRVEDEAIKSNFSNLVIDAVTQPVSMHEVNGSPTQKWYFVPENEWPDGRLIVPSVKYFFVVSQDNGLVLDISTVQKGAHLILSEVNGESSQLWRWDEDGRLVSKLGLVADIKGKSKKAGAVCHVWDAHDGLNQKWRVEDEAIKSNFSNLVIDAVTEPVSMHEVNDSPTQKWYFVPENEWPDGRLIVPSVKYFFVVSQDNGLALDISTGEKGGNLLLSKADGKPSQLWRWDKACRLVSKLGLVADIKGKGKKAEAVCHAWNAHDDLNQKWRVEDEAIKSNLSNLVIDALTQPVSMQEVNGSPTQKWYFVPENEWPDGRLIVPSVKYFFILSQDNGLVLDISTGNKGGNLLLSEADGRPSQLWRWDEDCRLVSKLGLVADIKHKSKKTGAVCHAWDAHDGLNQKWRVEDETIKSDFNNLVIDAVTQLVSMHAVNGSATQKWYFVPENEWPDGRQIVPSVKYFFILSQDNGLVLDISTGEKGGNLLLTEADEKPSQLWRWDEDCRLVSKLGLVADIKHKSKKAEAVCHAWDAHDGLNQKWRVEDEAIKSNLSNLVIDAVTQPVSMHEANGSQTQKWYFVPENEWPDGRLIVPSVKYFFVVSQDNGLVLDISTVQKGAHLVLSEVNKESSQLWRWDEDGRLVSKLGLVADIKGKSKKAGAVCHAWDAHDDLNQKWRVEDEAIKSNFSNLVIDAVTQPVSMHEVNGSPTQKWYFVPENEWPDGRLIVPSVKYFFVVSQDNGLVLDISTVQKGAHLVLSEVNGESSQLWRWDEDGRLVSKLGLVADIKGKSKKAGAVCHVWDAHDGLNQKWRVEDEAIKSNFSNLVIDAVTEPVSMHEVNDSPTQKWYFVPENEWPDGRLIVPSVKYFFVVSQDNGLALDISTGEKGGNLLLSKADGKPSQLWRWDKACRLVSKLGLVADIKGKGKKAEAVCHAWNAHDDLNQKWRVEDEAIKSNLSNLVIDALTQPVSMQEVNGSPTQKWYFVPENEWPDGRLIVPSVKYFFILSQDNGLVLDISTGNKGGNLLLSEADGRPSQLWRWDEDCRLVSKLGLVADIKHKSKKTGAVCHAWDAHDGLNQKWRVEDETIKSDFNNLVIDAVTQLVSMHAVNGSATQKWYFVPENEWPDGRQIVPSVKYFFILSQDNGLVLDISTGEKGGNLLLTEADEKPSQLWRWDEDCRLVSKLGLVADIKHKSKKAEAVCHAWDAHDGLNQKWRVEDEAIKSNLSNLVIDAVTQPVSMHEANGSQTQKWYFVPENEWPDGRLIVPSVKYFFVVSQDNGLVLDISTVQKGAHLVLSEVNKESSQLWRWDEDGRLVSKLGLVADIKGKSKKAGAVCHAWDAHDDLNQKWRVEDEAIKSNFSNLVIDAVTQPVSMHEVNGSPTQKWYFVPENEWPDGRLIVPSVKYFFVVSQDNGLVLDISTVQKGAHLVLSEVNGESSQLWRWDEDGRLVSKLGLVADIKGKSKKAGAVCHVWDAHDGLNQKWRVEDEAIKSNFSNLVIDAVTEPVSMHEVNDSPTQKWYFVPENEWPDGRLIVPSVKYFFVVSQDNGLALDISTGEKGGNLLLSKADGKPSQLWRWDKACRLVSKLGLVADIKGKGKKAEAVCHAWNAHDDLNQKWRVEDEAIKSNLSNLVIDALTQPVSMQEVNGSPTQKWYFVPENEWPDGRLIVPSVKYFFILSQDNGLVLDISTGNKGGNLLLSEADGRPSQLWRWDEDCRLVSKLGLVADIKHKSKKTGAVCHAWDAHDGLNQKWRVEDETIKSDFNNLVIDAVTQLVSMHAVNGSATQKWYFVPENEWPDGRQIVPSVKYFFILSQDNGLVLDISTGEKGGNLLLTEADEKPSQLWRWDEDCRLVSKLGLVADIKHKSKKAEAVCHAWDAHDGLNQKWRVEDEAIKSNLSNLVIDAVTQPVSMHEANGSQTQKWYFVPENEWPDGRLIVPSVKYFFVVSQDNGLVLDISTVQKGAHLVLSEVNKESSQLWRWDEDGRLVSKLGLVADIKGKSKKAGAVCHAWDAHDDLNQKWRVEDEAIKSNFSNLVIDAVTQPVSMHEVNGSPTQKWYFVPENEWPDGRLIVPSVKYFFVVSQDNGLVLDISTVQKGAHLVLSEVNGESSHLWRWDEDGRLVSKLGLVADIKGKSKKAGAVCHAWDAHNGLNQKWRVEDKAIKSNFNNLVIDAVTEPVSMHEVNGSPTQKWYFVPENEWPDGRLIVPSVKYFFIVSQDNGLVLDISTGEKDGNLVLSKAHSGSSQLWRWDEDCRLVSKLGLVADIKGKSKKAGAVCHAWDAHDGLNQKWRVEEGAIKSNLSNLVIDAVTQPVSMHEVRDTPTLKQKWHFFPENAWDDLQLVQADPNPLNKAQFWKTLADNYLDVIIGYTIDDYEDKVHKAFKTMEECSSELNKVAKDTGIARTVGGSAQIIGGGLAIAGLALAPVTAGASIGLTIAGVATCTAGGVTSFSSFLVNHVWDRKRKKKITKTTAPLFRATFSLQGFLNEYINNLKEAAEFLKTPKGEAVATDAHTHIKLAGEAMLTAANTAKAGYNLAEGVRNLKQAKQITALVKLIQADYYATEAVDTARVGLATQAAAPGIRMFGKTIVAAGTTAAKAISGSMAAFAIAFGIWDVIGGAKKITNGSELAEEFHKSSERLKEESAKLIALYKELQ